MKSTKKPKKTALLKSASTNKTMPKKVISTNRPVQKKLVGSKKFKIIHPMGIFAAIGGSLGLVILTTSFMSNMLASTPDNNSSVLGVTTELPAPTDFTVKVENYTAKLSWTYNAPSTEYNYRILFYDKNLQMYMPASWVNVNEPYQLQYESVKFDGTKVTKYIDQIPGETVKYKVALCYGDCKIDYQIIDGKTTGWTVVQTMGILSSEVSFTMPKIKTPTGFKANEIYKNIKLSWNAIPGVDGYNIWRSTNLVGTYTKVGSVGIPGTYSARHTLNSDGTLDIPINVSSTTTFTDKTAIKGGVYFYKVSATKMIAPLSYSDGWLNVESSHSIFKFARIR